MVTGAVAKAVVMVVRAPWAVAHAVGEAFAAAWRAEQLSADIRAAEAARRDGSLK